MNLRSISSGVLPILMAWLLLLTEGGAQTSANLSTRFLARGEQAILRISAIGGNPDRQPRIPSLPGVEIQDAGFGGDARMLPGRRRTIEHSFRYVVSSYEVGRHVIPPIEVSIGGRMTTTEPVEFVVFDPDDLRWAEIAAGGRTMRYASSFHVLEDQPYLGQTVPAEVKIYIPVDEARIVEDWGVPEFKLDGVAAWRFEAGDSHNQLMLLGRPYISLAYVSSIAPTRTGPVSIGPASVRLILRQTVLDGYQRHFYEEVFLDAPQHELESRPLPDGAPSGFENAVGSFTLSASVSDSEVREGDPIAVDLIVRGSGNLDTMQPPKLLDDNGWKTYDVTPNQRGDERRKVSGFVTFRQFLRPLGLKSSVPPFRLVYFDPADETYKTAASEPIALNMVPGGPSLSEGLAPPPTLAVPVERMSDILAVIRPSRLFISPGLAIPSWSGHLVAALAALALIAKALWMRFSHLLRKDPVRARRIVELGEIGRASADDDTGFLKAAGAFIERWLATHPDPDLQGILSERDAVCFRSEKPRQVLDRRRRDEIVKILRKAAMAMLFVFGMGLAASPAARAGDASKAMEAYEAARYDEAVRVWLGAAKYEHLSADVLYNIGNACYRMGSPGHAALYYRRALHRDATHQEARQNLRFIERKYGSITVQRPNYQYAIAKLPLSFWKGSLWTGAWLIVLAALVFPASWRGARIRVAAVCALVIGPLAASAGALGWYYFPNDSAFAPVERQAVIVGEKVVLHTDAARTAPEVIDAPPGSLCEIVRKTGRWAYVAFATQTRGWVPLESIEMVIPESPPVPPEIRRPKADASSA